MFSRGDWFLVFEYTLLSLQRTIAKGQPEEYWRLFLWLAFSSDLLSRLEFSMCIGDLKLHLIWHCRLLKLIFYTFTLIRHNTFLVRPKNAGKRVYKGCFFLRVNNCVTSIWALFREFNNFGLDISTWNRKCILSYWIYTYLMVMLRSCTQGEIVCFYLSSNNDKIWQNVCFIQMQL